MMPGRLNEDQGIILPIVLILTLALMITGLVFISLGVQENSLVRREIAKRQAFYLAEAGVEVTIWQFKDSDSSWDEWTKDANGNHSLTETLQDPQGSSVGNYKVVVEDKEGDNPVIESTGYVSNVEKTVRVTLKTHHPIFDYAVASSSGIKVEDTQITGDLYAIGDIDIEDATIEGDVTATGRIDGQETITGEKTEEAEPLPFPEFDSGYYTDLNPEIVDEWDEDKEHDLKNRIWYVVTGNVTISNSTLVGPGSIVAAEGTITVEGDSQVGTSKDDAVSLISASEEDDAIKIEGGNEENPTEVWGVLWAPNGTIKIEYSTLHGSVVSGSIYEIETGSKVIFKQFSKDSYSYVTRPVYSVQQWEEK